MNSSRSAGKSPHVSQEIKKPVRQTASPVTASSLNTPSGILQLQSIVGNRLALQYLQDASNHSIPGGPVVQRYFEVDSGNLAGYVQEQKNKQNLSNMQVKAESIEPFTTVGFEHEFAQTEEETLSGISHLELAHSTEKMPYTDLPFILETDAFDALELVSPPFLMRTMGSNSPIPDPRDVERVDTIIRNSLSGLISGNPTLEKLTGDFKSVGLSFALQDAEVQPKHLSHRSAGLYDKNSNKVKAQKLKQITVKKSTKGGGITTQVNFATDAETFVKMQNLDKQDENDSAVQNNTGEPKKTAIEQIFSELDKQLMQLISEHISDKTGNLSIFIPIMARTLSGQFAVPSIGYIKSKQEELFASKKKQQENIGSRKGPSRKPFIFSAAASSAVKDTNGVWIKDTLMNIGLGILQTADWKHVHNLVRDPGFRSKIDQLSLPSYERIKGFEGFDQEGNAHIQNNLRQAKVGIMEALEIIAHQIEHDILKEEPASFLGPEKSIPFMSHEPTFIGPRQDTYIAPAEKVQIPYWQQKGKRLHVVETRDDNIESLYKLAQTTPEYKVELETKIKELQELTALLEKPGYEGNQVLMMERLMLQNEIMNLMRIGK
ncbi:hypothetical protein [Paenibacillus hamazuiensis]|uniref:hypothetical protein n=1 Tax=Paenibacillus hamazuiensis TaxID=2936508 RepID=UPI00200D8F87|nr:hypothetical protein [Paenibacillus hamazuiensis]